MTAQPGDRAKARGRWRRRVAFAALGALAATAAAGQTVSPVEATLKGAGLSGGPFAADCTQPPSLANWQANFSGITIVWLADPKYRPNVYLVQEARTLPDGALALKADFQRDHAVADLVYAIRSDKNAFRLMSARVTHGSTVETVVDQGVFVKTKYVMPWYVHCAP